MYSIAHIYIHIQIETQYRYTDTDTDISTHITNTHRYTQRNAHKHTERQTNEHTERHTETHTEKSTYTQRPTHMHLCIHTQRDRVTKSCKCKNSLSTVDNLHNTHHNSGTVSNVPLILMCFILVTLPSP